MAGAGIGKCVVCGRDNQPLISDICQDCHMKEFHAGLESAPLQKGTEVWLINNGYKDFSQQWVVVVDFNGGWSDSVLCMRADRSGAIHLHKREIITSK